MPRKALTKNVEVEVLIASRRRCAICFGLNSDFSIKKGQIAHIDRNSSNDKLDNLVFLCLEHHDAYDSKTSQSKGLRTTEVTEYKSLLAAYISHWELEKRQTHLVPPSKSSDIFHFYRLLNPESICGYENLAVSESQDRVISFSEGHFSIAQVYWEVIQWLNCDYESIECKSKLPVAELSKFIKVHLFEDDYSLTAYFDVSKKINDIVLAFSESNKYYEIEYEIRSMGLVKTAKTMYSFTETPARPLHSSHPDIGVYKGLRSILGEIQNSARRNLTNQSSGRSRHR